jgi:TRAP-type C4-dicarboxylate transport system permease small subunit
MRRIFNAMGMAAGLLMGFATLLAAVNAICRYALNHSIVWAEELSTYICVLIVFVALAWMESEDRQLKIDIFNEKVKNEALKRAIFVLRGLVTLAIFALLIYSGFHTIVSTYNTHSVTYVLKIPRFILYIFVVFSYVFASIGWLGVLLLNKGRTFK